jgi:hypothetical protein
MSYLVFCTFDLQNANQQDYTNAYNDLEKIGLEKIVAGNKGNDVVIPTTSVMGEFNGDTASSVRNEIRNQIKEAFTSRGFDSEIFIIVGGDWAWAAATT